MELNEVERMRYYLLVSQIVFGAGYCMVLYDWLCCLNREYKFIWKVKFSFIKVIYLFCRYWPIATVPYVLWAYTVPHTLDTCKRIFRIPVAFATWNQLGAETVLLARTVAFFGNSHAILCVLSLCLVTATAYQYWVVFKPMTLIPFIADDRYGVCLPTSSGREILGYFLSSLGFDTLVTILMICRVFQLRRRAGGDLSRSPLIQLLVSEGLWYFVLVSIANLVNGLMFAQGENDLQAVAAPFSAMLPPILACRLILDIREHGSAEGNAWLATGKGNVGFVVPAFLYHPKPGPAPSPVSAIRFRSADHRKKSSGPQQGSSATDRSEVSIVSNIQFMNADGVDTKKSFVGDLTSVRGGGEEDGVDIGDAREVLVSPVKPEGELATPGVDNQFYLAYQMVPIRSPGRTISKAREERGERNVV